MHLVGPQMTTTVYSRRRKNKGTVIDAKFVAEFRSYNKQMRRLKLKEKTLEEYIAYKQGKSNYTPRVVKSPLETTSYIRPSPPVNSGNGVGNGFVKPANVYTGGNLLGIATMHKSNMVPVFSQSDAEEISKMRRG
jgi:hypothetical protein